MVEIGEPANSSVTSVLYRQYIANPIRPSKYLPPYEVQGEILASDTPEQIAQFVGSTPAAVMNYSVYSRPYWVAAKEIVSRGMTGGWSDAYYAISTPVSSGFIALAAISLVLDPVDRQISWLAWSLLSTRDFYETLAALNIGPNGAAYLIRPKGRQENKQTTKNNTPAHAQGVATAVNVFERETDPHA